MSEPSLCLTGQGCLVSIRGKVRLGAALSPPGTSLMGSWAVCKLIFAVRSLGSILRYPAGQDGMRLQQRTGLFYKVL